MINSVDVDNYHRIIKSVTLLNSKTKEMKTKSEIVDNWLVRYTGLELKSFGEYILLTNFDKYVKIFAENSGCEINGEDKNMTSATSKNITIINFGMGSPNAATIMDLLSAILLRLFFF